MSRVVKPHLLQMYKHYRFAVAFGLNVKPQLKHRLMIQLLNVLHMERTYVRKKHR